MSPRFLFALALALGPLALYAGCAREIPCSFNSDCVNAYCDNGTCKQDCVDSTRDCPAGQTCNVNAQCEPISSGPSSSSSGGTGGSGGDPSSSSGPSGSSSTSSTSSGPSSSSSSTSSSGGVGHELDLCASDANCASPLMCRALVRFGEKRCTRPCSSNNDCFAGTRCELVDGTQYCAGDDTGRTCNNVSTCNFGCLLNQQYCTVPCLTGSDCPNGYGCMGVGNPSTRVCVKAEAPCSSQDASACIAPSACDESITMVVGGCTLLCNSAADCPRRGAGLPAWSCQSGLCKRPSDVHGPLPTGYAPAQYACDASLNVVNVCNDNLHIDFATFSIPGVPSVNCNSPVTTDGFPGDACVDSCRYQGGCPYGSTCVAVGGVGNARVGLCLPKGGAEVGSPCGQDGDCAFSYCLNGVCSRDCTADGICPGGSSCQPGGGPAVEGAAFKRCQ